MASRAQARPPALIAGAVVLLLVGLCCAIAARSAVQVDPQRGALTAPGTDLAVLFGFCQIAAFGAYGAGLALIRRSGARLHAVILLALAIQLIPLLAPLLMSSDTLTYWGMGRIGSVHGGDPYVDTIGSFPGDPSVALVPSGYRDLTTPYGPLFTLVSQGVALLAGDSSSTATLLFRCLAALSVVGIVLLVARVAPRRAFAAAFVGWNPIVALNFAGGGHNDALMMLLLVVGIALVERRPQLAGASWALAIGVKFIPIVFVPLQLVERRARGRPLGAWGFVATTIAIVAVATVLYGPDWLGTIGSVFGVATRRGFGGVADTEGVGVPRLVVYAAAVVIFAFAYLWLLRQAATTRAHLGIAAVMLLVAVLISPQVLWPWYLIWAVPLVALEDDLVPQLAALGLCLYELNVLGDSGTLLSLLR
ncbi:MAG: glycosyltransferase 87 family protein [Candidatus Limnocylindrales bacterium]